MAKPYTSFIALDKPFTFEDVPVGTISHRKLWSRLLRYLSKGFTVTYEEYAAPYPVTITLCDLPHHKADFAEKFCRGSISK